MFKEGDKVIPILKSVGSTFKESYAIKAMKESNRNYLKINTIEGDMFNCDGDFFLQSDLVPYEKTYDKDKLFGMYVRKEVTQEQYEQLIKN